MGRGIEIYGPSQMADPSRLKILKDGTGYWNWWSLPECIYDSRVSPRIRRSQTADPRILIEEKCFLQYSSRSVYQPQSVDLIPTKTKWFDELPPKVLDNWKYYLVKAI